MPACWETYGTFHYLLKYYKERDGGEEKSRRKKPHICGNVSAGGRKANPTTCGRYSCVVGWLNCMSIELMYPLNRDKSSEAAV